MKTILVVDDEPAIRFLLQAILKKHGYNLLVAGHGIEALAVATAHAGEIDLLLTDVQMPEMNGLDLASSLVKSRPKTKVIFITGQPGRYRDRLSDKLVVTKPFDQQLLVTTIRAELEVGV